jgi:predicted metal-dependent hydrolase
MSLEPKRNRFHSVAFGGSRIEFQIQRSKRRTLAITVRPDGNVVATAPQTADIALVIPKIRKRGRWIQKQQRYFERFLPPTAPRKYVSGETHRYLGRQYRLKVSSQRPYGAKLTGRYLFVNAPTKAEEHVRPIVQKWFMARAREQFTKRLKMWDQWCATRSIKVPKLQLRRMTKRWGSSKPIGRVCLNSELIGAPSICIDYVIAHEICHLKFPKHDKKFYELLTQACPNWRDVKQRLEESLS